MFDTHKNFAIGTVLTAPVDASGKDFVLMPGDGEAFTANMPVTLCPPNVQPTGDNSEIGYLTAVDGDQLTITRAQEGSLPMQLAGNWQVIGSVTAKSLRDIEESVATAFSELECKQPAGEYATADEVAAGLSGKAAQEHTHTESDITNLDKYFTLLNTPGDAVTSVNGQVGIIVLGKSDVGLGNVDNTSDASKPVSTAQQTALDAKVNKAGDTMTGNLWMRDGIWSFALTAHGVESARQHQSV